MTFRRHALTDGTLMAAPNALLSPAQKPAELWLPDNSAAFGLQTRSDPRYLFYCYTCGPNERSRNVRDEIGGGLYPPYWWTVWRPGSWPSLPPGLPNQRLRLRFLFRSGVHWLHLFAGSYSGILLIYDHRRVVHYSGFTPRYWRFPFVADDDFQIGDTWTDPAHRRRGLAYFALQTIVTMLAKPGRRLWYVVEDVNEPSIRVVEKAQFTPAAEGTWVRPWGLKLTGAYVIRSEIPA
jgi:RimJ/RimL family protein N-acetyltransferase